MFQSPFLNFKASGIKKFPGWHYKIPS